MALPDGARHTEPDFERYVPDAVVLADRAGNATGEARVFLGALAGSASPVRVHSPLLGAEILLAPGAEAAVDVDPGFEHGLLADNLPAFVEGTEVPIRTLAYVAPGASALRLANPGNATLRLLLLGGAPFDEEITMWWNFVGRGHEEIVEYREAWQREIGAMPGGTEGDAARFGPVVELTGGDSALLAPELPHVRLRPRGGSRERNAR